MNRATNYGELELIDQKVLRSDIPLTFLMVRNRTSERHTESMRRISVTYFGVADLVQ
jgi:hypothetical protein